MIGIKHLSEGRGCIKCDEIVKINNIPFNKSFASHPKSKQWSSKNELKPNNLLKGSSKQFIFNCDVCKHEFIMAISSITYSKQWCPYCEHHKLCDNECDMCFNNSFASSTRAKDWSELNICKPRNVFKSTSTKYMFNCDVCKHVFTTTPNNITQDDQWCNYCESKILCGNINCDTCFKKSFASHPKSKFWSVKNELKPINYHINSTKQIIFNCDVCNHEFIMGLSSVTSEKQWCPYCAHQKLCDNDCEMCFENSFASSKYSVYWSDLNTCEPRSIFKSSNKIYIFKCNVCNHIRNISPKKINLCKWCNYCENRALCDDENCTFCFNKSFASHYRVDNWSDKNIITPRMCLLNSNKKYIFNCTLCQKEYITILTIITKHNSWCPCKKNKTETKLYDHLLIEYKEQTIIKEMKFDWCKNIKKLAFDFLIENYKLIIELDGRQHMEAIPNWKSDPIEQQKTDMYKMECANNNGYSIIRILQEDVHHNKNNWSTNLKKAISIIQTHTSPTNIFIGEVYKKSLFHHMGKHFHEL